MFLLITYISVPSAPGSFLYTFLVESIFKIHPYTEIASARRVGILPQYHSHMQARNNLGVRRDLKGGVWS